MDRVLPWLAGPADKYGSMTSGRWTKSPLPCGRGSSYDTTVRRSLYQTLVAKLEPKLEGATRLHIVSDGILNLVPFDGLLGVTAGT